jgi:hypothetical protein
MNWISIGRVVTVTMTGLNDCLPERVYCYCATRAPRESLCGLKFASLQRNGGRRGTVHSYSYRSCLAEGSAPIGRSRMEFETGGQRLRIEGD